MLNKQQHNKGAPLKKFGKTIVSKLYNIDLEADEREGNARGPTGKIIAILVIALISLYVAGCLAIGINPVRYGHGFGPFHALHVGLGSYIGREAFFIIFCLFMCLFFYVQIKTKRKIGDDPRDFTFADNGTYGTSHLLKPKQYCEFLEITDSALETDGIIVGMTLDEKHVVSIPKNSPYNRNIFVCGSQGTSKSIAFVRNMIIQCAIRNESVFVIDSKSELFEDTAYYLRKEGYEIYQWNLINRWNSNGWDILHEINGDEELEYVEVLCTTIIQNTADERNAGDFFDKIETVLLEALVLYVVLEFPPDQRTLGDVYNMLLTESSESLDAKFSALPANHRARGPYNLFSKSPANKGNAILGLGSRLSIFQNEAVKKMTGFKEIDIEALAKRKVALFCIASDTNTTYNMLNALCISMAFIKIMAYADRQSNRKCDIPVHFILDEFPNIGEIDSIKQKEATARSRDIGIDIMIQNIPQFQNRYPDGVWEELIGGCDFRMILGCNEPTTAEYFSTLSGMSTINVNTERKQYRTLQLTRFTHDYTTSDGVGQRPTIMEDEVRRLDPDELLLFVRGQQPIQLKKFKFFQHPEALKFRQIKAHSIIPVWREDISDEEKKKSLLDTLVAEADNNDELLVVKDSEKYGMQRTLLADELHTMQAKYAKDGCFPNGHSLFDDRGMELDDEDIAFLNENLKRNLKINTSFIKKLQDLIKMIFQRANDYINYVDETEKIKKNDDFDPKGVLQNNSSERRNQQDIMKQSSNKNHIDLESESSCCQNENKKEENESIPLKSMITAYPPPDPVFTLNERDDNMDFSDDDMPDVLMGFSPDFDESIVFDDNSEKSVEKEKPILMDEVNPTKEANDDNSGESHERKSSESRERTVSGLESIFSKIKKD